MRSREEKKVLENNGEYIVIHKETVVNYFFTSVLVIALGLFLAIFITGVLKMSTQPEGGINSELVSYYQDDLLNLHYPMPGGTWAIVEFDNTELSETIEESWGEDEYFSIEDDVLTEEVISLLAVNEVDPDLSEDGGELVEGNLREFMSFTFMPDVSYQGEEFVEFCKSSFERTVEEGGGYTRFNLYFTEEDDSGGVLMRMSVFQEINGEDGETTEMETFYTQYIRRIGVNIGIITYGSLMEDETVDPYLRFFLSNVRTERSLME